MVDKNIKRCSKCIEMGHSNPEGPFLQVGKGKGKNILIVAESPAKNGWRVSGKACHTPEGKLLATGKRLNEYLEAFFGLNIETVSFTELAKCYLPERKYLEKSGLNCINFLEEQIKGLEPKLVITVGMVPKKVFSLRYGKEFEVGKIQKLGTFFYLPLYHPSPASPHGHKKNLVILEELNKELAKLV